VGRCQVSAGSTEGAIQAAEKRAAAISRPPPSGWQPTGHSGSSRSGARACRRRADGTPARSKPGNPGPASVKQLAVRRKPVGGGQQQQPPPGFPPNFVASVAFAEQVPGGFFRVAGQIYQVDRIEALYGRPLAQICPAAMCFPSRQALNRNNVESLRMHRWPCAGAPGHVDAFSGAHAAPTDVAQGLQHLRIYAVPWGTGFGVPSRV